MLGKFAVGMGLVLAAMGLASPAVAQLQHTRLPSAPCARHVPSGGVIDLAAGVIRSNGAVVGQTSTPCTESSSTGPEPDTATSGGYYSQLTVPKLSNIGGELQPTNAQKAGPTLTDDFGGVFNAPSTYPIYDGGPEYWTYWIGLVAWNWPDQGIGAPGGNVVLQPVFTWTGGSYYLYDVMYITAGPGQPFAFYTTALWKVALGDQIETYIYQYASNPDAWIVGWVDITQNDYGEYFGVQGIPSTFPKFNTAYLVLEGFSDGSTFGPLPSCADLAPLGNLTYDLLTFDEGVPPTYTPFSPTWHGAAYPGVTSYPPTSPSCSFGWQTSGANKSLTFAP
jgi:hypothetical protein